MKLKRVATVWVILLLANGCVCGDYQALPESDGYGMVGDSILSIGNGGCASVGVFLSLLMGEGVPNLALDGAQVDLILTRYYALEAAQPSLHTVIANGGTNNLKTGQPAEEVYDEILNLWQVILADGHDLTYLLPYHYRGAQEIVNPAVDELDALLLVACDDLVIDCIDVRDTFDAHPEYYMDTIHPTVYARTIIADHINAR
jgi:hypothetical protein